MKPNSISKNNNRGRQHKWITRTAFMFAAFGLLASVPFAQITPVQSNFRGVTAMIGSPAIPEHEFCWRDSYGRSVGTVPGRVADCPATYTNNGATCGRGTDTIAAPSRVANCPAGYRNMGLTCYNWRKVKSLGPSSMVCSAGYHKSAITARCIVDCPAGYTNTGETCFKPASTLGMGSMSCKEGEKRVSARCYPNEGVCGAGQVFDAGLCYPKCKPGYNGVGPVCWGDPPPGWVKCGMGAAKDSATCASMVFGQVFSVGKLAFAFYAKFHKAAAAKYGPENKPGFFRRQYNKAKNLKKEMQQNYKELKDEFELLKKENEDVRKAAQAYDDANKLRKGYKPLATAGDAETEEDMIRSVAELMSFAGMADPTGIVSGIGDVVAAYTYPKCSKYGYSPTGPATPPTEPETPSSCANFVGEFETACRGADNGGDSNDPEAKKDSNKYFDLYKYQKENGKRSLSACQAACKDRCTGVEYNDSNGRCELWKVPITGGVPQKGYNCYTRR